MRVMERGRGGTGWSERRDEAGRGTEKRREWREGGRRQGMDLRRKDGVREVEGGGEHHVIRAARVCVVTGGKIDFDVRCTFGDVTSCPGCGTEEGTVCC